MPGKVIKLAEGVLDRAVSELLNKNNAAPIITLFERGQVDITSFPEELQHSIFCALPPRSSSIIYYKSAGGDVNITDADGKGVLHRSLEEKLDFGEFNQYRTHVIKGFIEEFEKTGGDMNHKDKEGKTPLCYFVEHEQREVIETALELGACPYTALPIAMQIGNDEALGAMLGYIRGVGTTDYPAE